MPRPYARPQRASSARRRPCSNGCAPPVPDLPESSRDVLGMRGRVLDLPKPRLTVRRVMDDEILTRVLPTGPLPRWQKKRGILRSVKDPKHGRFDLWEIAV